ncbi:MAG: hypothetical protein HJJLKODD_02250 [Phycisphaerae bacterium]|nr:hypothetical protein [Phycisphaerae bacterium]
MKLRYVLTIGVAGLIAGFMIGAGEPGNGRGTYNDARYGFTIQTPNYPAVPTGETVIPIMTFAPQVNGFCPNMHVMIQAQTVTADQYAQLTRDEFKTAKFSINSERTFKVSGRDALLWDYQGVQDSIDLRFLALAVIDTDKVYLLTAAAPPTEYPKYEAEFKACLESFQLAGR